MTDTIRFYRTTGTYGFLSNLWPSPVIFENRGFRSAEYAYQFGKPRNADLAYWLAIAPSSAICAFAAHALPPWAVRTEWNVIKVERMRAVLAAKFDQHPDLRERLLATGDATLIEVSKTDPFWGIGAKGTGKNTLGLLLMELRERVRI